MTAVRTQSHNRTFVGATGKPSYRREVVCPSCGQPREISDRHARRTEDTLCVACRFPAKRQPPGDADRRYWLERFTDEEIVIMVEAITDQKADIDRIAWWRRELKPKGRK